MLIPHKSKQKEGWLYWDFAADQQRYFNCIEIFVKNESIDRLSEPVYLNFWRYTHAFETLDIPENTDASQINSLLRDIKKELYLIGHFPFFGFEKQLRIQIPPMQFIDFPILGDYPFLGVEYDEIYGKPRFDTLRYRLKKVNVTDAWYELISKVSIKVE